MVCPLLVSLPSQGESLWGASSTDRMSDWPMHAAPAIQHVEEGVPVPDHPPQYAQSGEGAPVPAAAPDASPSQPQDPCRGLFSVSAVERRARESLCALLPLQFETERWTSGCSLCA
jgi:hypothetical protein